VQYDNRGGAGGTIGLAQFVNASRGDPNALMVGGQAMVSAVELNRSAVKVQQATPLARLVAEYSVIVVPANSPYKTMADVIKAFKENPGKVSWGAGSAGSTEHLLIGLIAKAVGVEGGKINYIAFKGGGEAVPAIIGGHVAVGASGLGEFAEHIKSGKMRALAVSSPTAMEGIPSLKEQGIDVVFGNWRGIWAAPGITPQQRETLIKQVKTATETAEWKGMLAKMGWTPVVITGDEFGRFVDDESKSLGQLVDALGLRK
jgi:putative tricarboxylic transport membrane protein